VDKFSPGIKLIYEDGYGNAISTRRSLALNGKIIKKNQGMAAEHNFTS